MFDKIKKKVEEAGKQTASKALDKISPKTVTGTGDPKETAIRCYEALQKGDRDTWTKTLTLHLQKIVDTPGSTPSFWWNTGRHYIEDYGVYYEFLKEEKAQFPNNKKFFFKRKNADGSDRGAPVPCTLRIDEDGVWRVDQQSV